MGFTFSTHISQNCAVLQWEGTYHMHSPLSFLTSIVWSSEFLPKLYSFLVILFVVFYWFHCACMGLFGWNVSALKPLILVFHKTPPKPMCHYLIVPLSSCVWWFVPRTKRGPVISILPLSYPVILDATFSPWLQGPGPDARVVYIDGAFDLFHAGHVEVCGYDSLWHAYLWKYEWSFIYFRPIDICSSCEHFPFNIR